MKNYYIGVDTGGTFIKSGIVSSTGEVLYQNERPTESRGGTVLVQDNIAKAIRELQQTPEGKKVKGVGIGIGALVRFTEGIILEAPNIPFKNFPFRDALSRMMDLPVVIDNDANVAMLAEQWKGAARDVSEAVLLTLGTGVGGALVLNNKLYRGRFGYAAELGHMIVSDGSMRCTAGHKGCLEGIVGGIPLLERARREVDPEIGSVREIAKRANEGETSCQKIFADVGTALARQVASLIHIINPGVVIFGGHVAAAWELFNPALRTALVEHTFETVLRDVQIVHTTLPVAGVLGAGRLAMMEL